MLVRKSILKNLNLLLNQQNLSIQILFFKYFYKLIVVYKTIRYFYKILNVQYFYILSVINDFLVIKTDVFNFTKNFHCMRTISLLHFKIVFLLFKDPHHQKKNLNKK
jgi:hypothetical protein